MTGQDGALAVDERLDRLLLTSGYAESQLRRNEDVWTPTGKVRSPIVGFARTFGPYDTSTATIVGSSAVGAAGSAGDRLLEAAVALAAPVVLTSARDGVTIRSISSDGRSLFEQQFSWDSAYRDLPRSLNPRVLLSAKLGQRQGTLFPVDATLLTSARTRTEDALGPRVAQLLDAAADVLDAAPGKEGAEAKHARAARLVIGALTAVVLRDKEFGGPDSLSGGALFDMAMQRHATQFRWAQNLAMWESEILDGLIEELSVVDFSFAEPVLLSHIYESRLVNNAARRQLGAHYTPPRLAERILRYLPIEELPPEQRKVLDPTSGSGTLLLAAHDRLAGLQPQNMGPAESHRALVAQLHGSDIDPVAVEIANLSLLLHALPAGNGWKVTEGDALQPHPRGEYDIVVANPPWKWTNKAKHDDVAHDFLERMLRRLRPGGLLGVVLPVAWLTRQSSQSSRDLVRRQCEVFETWRLPPGTFDGADSGAAVLLARRQKSSRRPVARPLIVREVTHQRDLTDFYRHGRCVTTLAPEPSDEVFASGPLSRWWAARGGSDMTIADYAVAVSGPQPASPSERERRGVADVSPNAAFLPEPSDVARFARVERRHLVPIAFPEQMQQGSGRGGRGLDRRKVLVGAAMAPNVAWRLRVSLDETGALPRNTATMLMPDPKGPAMQLTEDEILFGLLAYLGSGFASAFVADTIQTRKIGAPQVRALPAPDPATLRRLSKLGAALADAATQGLAPEVARLRRRLDARVWAWSGVPADLRADIERRLFPDGNSTQAQSPAIEKQAWPRVGHVEDLDLERGLRLRVAGLGDAQWCGLPLRFPGAAIRPGSSFVVRLADGQSVADAEYAFDEAAYLSDHEILEFLSDYADNAGEERPELAP